MKRKVDPNSAHNVMKQLDRVKLWDEGKPWTQQNVDHLLDCFYFWDLKYKAEKGPCLLMEIGRSHKAIFSHVWKYMTRYPRKGIQDYVPEKRQIRTEAEFPFTERDIATIYTAVSDMGRQNKAHQPAYIARVIGRPTESVSQWMLDRFKEVNVLIKPTLSKRLDEKDFNTVAEFLNTYSNKKILDLWQTVASEIN